ncbi:S1C family serine protease [Aquisphaera insulae]|uniref:S1C family serine protease n=1 Tax=Aquisphaera insulae TaxID=2712864 RepID=UPI0013E9D083|nr:trypsin-like peptidase domain-containing protein [Aquisphaera insulae]
MPTSGPSRMTRLAARIAICGLALALAAALGAGFQRGAWPWPPRPAAPAVGDHPEAQALTNGSGPVSDPGATASSNASRAVEPDPGAGSVADRSATTPEEPLPTASGRHRKRDRDQGDSDRDDSAALFATMERLERLIGAGMARARASVVSLEYTSAEASNGSRRMACGVVINASGDLLSVRIDRPTVAVAATPAPAPTPAASPAAPPAPPAAAPAPPSPIVARDVAGRRHLAHWVAYDPESGLTLLQIPARAVKPIEIAAEEPVLGGQVFVTGNAFGLGHTVSRGYVTGLDRALKLGVRQLGGLIQVQARIYPGDSGAAVTNQRGQLLGLIRSGLAPPAAGEAADQAPRARDRDRDRDSDFGFAIAARDLLWVADQLRAHGHVDRAYLGVRLEPAAGAAEAADNPLAEGAALQEVIKGSPAATAGLRAGDLIVAIDDQPVRSPSDLTDRLDRLPSQALVRLDIIRGLGAERRPISMELRTSSRPDASPAQAAAGASPNPTPVPNAPTPAVADRKPPPPGVPPLNVVPTAATPGHPVANVPPDRHSP